ncbi:secreted protein [Candidatus Magnetomorum sp. HK-1]|nr:secreted protein [Candidatus Magnetomorum sp. HK-1]
MKLNKKLLSIYLITLLVSSVSYAKIPGDIDGNGVLNLKDCLQILHKIANPTDEIQINLIQAKPLVSGTYSQLRQSAKTTYTFNEDGTCVRVGPDNFGGSLTTEGTWHYENERLHINTSGEIMVFVAKYQVNIDEQYAAAFTNEDASKLILAPPGKNMDNMPDIIGRYTGAGEVYVTLPKMSYGNQTILIESIIDVKSDGSWESVVTIETNGQPVVERDTGKVDPSMPTIYVFGSSFYPDIFSSDNETGYFDRE